MILKVPELIGFRGCISRLVIATNGCFDLLHAAHIRFLEEARTLVDRDAVFIIGLNSDVSVKALKGPNRPIIPERERAEMLNALACVSHVCIFEGVRCVDFLMACCPDVYVKGGDYTLETLDAGERDALGLAQIKFIPMTQGISTTEIIRRIKES